LGLTLQIDTAFLAGASLTVAGIFVLLIQVRQAKTADKESLATIKAQFGRLALIIPQNGSELARFYMLSVTAGIVEELLWRGYMIWYLGQVMPLWAAALASTIGFGLAHAYQGLANLPKITLVGAAFAGLYLLSGSIWLPMLLHVAVDILQGRLAYEAIHQSGSAIAGIDGKGAKTSP
jgi:membrane protease YdiL (CAAX protease family)